MRTHTYARTHSHSHTLARSHTHAHTHAHTLTHIHTRTRTHTHAHTLTHTRTHTHTRTRTHTECYIYSNNTRVSPFFAHVCGQIFLIHRILENSKKMCAYNQRRDKNEDVSNIEIATAMLWGLRAAGRLTLHTLIRSETSY